jgi:hypothetical protein
VATGPRKEEEEEGVATYGGIIRAPCATLRAASATIAPAPTCGAPRGQAVRHRQADAGASRRRVEHGARREGNVVGVARELAHLGAPQLHTPGVQRLEHHGGMAGS